MEENLSAWRQPPLPSMTTLEGRYTRLEKATPLHCLQLAEHLVGEAAQELWTYLPAGPFATVQELTAWIETGGQRHEPTYAIIDTVSERAVGVAGYMRLRPEHGSLEVGRIVFSLQLQRTRLATEAMYLMMEHIFALGYRRYEWKCNTLNERSLRAAKRLGFSYEGTFRQDGVVKGRNRDTAWFSIIDKEWPALQRAFARWLDPANFDQNGRQRSCLLSSRM